MYEGFERARIPSRLGDINLVHAGNGGPPLLLLHGYLQTHVAWRVVAPRLAKRFHVIAADLPGHGDSAKPPAGEGNINYAKRTMGEAFVDVMEAFGYSKFNIAGHDRGGRVAYRLALDHPERLEKLCVLDMSPTIESFEMAEKNFRAGFGMYHWFFLAQDPPLPELMLEKSAESYLRIKMDKALVVKEAVTPEAMAEYIRCFTKPETIHGTCNDYRATATIDCEHDLENRKNGDKITVPTLVIIGSGVNNPTVGTRGGKSGGVVKTDVMFEAWRRWVVDPICVTVPCGHYVPEEAADEVARQLLDFFPR